jgi:hypothetical protein
VLLLRQNRHNTVKLRRRPPPAARRQTLTAQFCRQFCQKNHTVRCRGPEGPVHLVDQTPRIPVVLRSCSSSGKIIMIPDHSFRSFHIPARGLLSSIWKLPDHNVALGQSGAIQSISLGHKQVRVQRDLQVPGIPVLSLLTQFAGTRLPVLGLLARSSAESLCTGLLRGLW